MVSPFPAIDTSRTTERLSAFLAEYIEEKPVDMYFEDYPVVNSFYKRKRMKDGGAQWSFPIGTGESPNSAWAGEYDVVGSAGTNLAQHVVFVPVNIFDSLTISFVEMREIAGSDHSIFDRVSYKRDVIMNTTLKRLNEGFFAAAQASDQVTAFPIAIAASGACGSLTTASQALWASQVVNHAAAYTADGYGAMLQLYDNLRQYRGKPSIIFTSYAIERSIEKEYNVDVRYTDSPDTLKRGAAKLIFKNLPIVADADATASTIYFVSENTCNMYVDVEGDMQFFDMQMLEQQFVYMSKFLFRGNVVITDRRAQGKITNVS